MKTMNSKLRNGVLLVICLAVPLALGFLSSLLSGDIRGTYEMMNKPPLSPPGSVFGIVWPILYVLMGLASWVVLISPARNNMKRPALILYGAQLLVNFTWTIIFFRADALWFALVVILVLDLLVILTLRAFHRIHTAAMLLMVPYIVWILFATYLNISFAIVN